MEDEYGNTHKWSEEDFCVHRRHVDAPCGACQEETKRKAQQVQAELAAHRAKFERKSIRRKRL